ncbi:hypothetical protein ABK040_002267 [Willaertia magna]
MLGGGLTPQAMFQYISQNPQILQNFNPIQVQQLIQVMQQSGIALNMNNPQQQSGMPNNMNNPNNNNNMNNPNINTSNTGIQQQHPNQNLLQPSSNNNPSSQQQQHSMHMINPNNTINNNNPNNPLIHHHHHPQQQHGNINPMIMMNKQNSIPTNNLIVNEHHSTTPISFSSSNTNTNLIPNTASTPHNNRSTPLSVGPITTPSSTPPPSSMVVSGGMNTVNGIPMNMMNNMGHSQIPNSNLNNLHANMVSSHNVINNSTSSAFHTPSSSSMNTNSNNNNIVNTVVTPPTGGGLMNSNNVLTTTSNNTGSSSSSLLQNLSKEQKKKLALQPDYKTNFKSIADIEFRLEPFKEIFFYSIKKDPEWETKVQTVAQKFFKSSQIADQHVMKITKRESENDFQEGEIFLTQCLLSLEKASWEREKEEIIKKREEEKMYLMNNNNLMMNTNNNIMMNTNNISRLNTHHAPEEITMMEGGDPSIDALLQEIPVNNGSSSIPNVSNGGIYNTGGGYNTGNDNDINFDDIFGTDDDFGNINNGSGAIMNTRQNQNGNNLFNNPNGSNDGYDDFIF